MLKSILIKKQILKNDLLRKSYRYLSSLSSSSTSPILGFIGLGAMGSKMIKNLRCNNQTIYIYDQNENAINNVLDDSNKDSFLYTSSTIIPSSIENISKQCNIIFSMLPNDLIVDNISQQLIVAQNKTTSNIFLHISCSTISPTIARKLSELHHKEGIYITLYIYILYIYKYNEYILIIYVHNIYIYVIYILGHLFVTSPVFARPDGIAKKQATWMIAGHSCIGIL